MLEPTPLKSGEAYGTVADIRDCSDLPEMPITPGVRWQDGSFEAYWVRADGTPITVLVTAPTLAARRLIEQAKDDMEFVLATCLHCVKEPKFSKEQLNEILANKNPAALVQISDTAWQLAEFPSQIIQRETRRLAGLPAEKKRKAKPAAPAS